MKKSFLIFLILLLFPAFTKAAIQPDIPTYHQARKTMVEKQIKNRGISDKAVLNAMAEVPRHYFVPKNLLSRAYADHPLPIGEGQTISPVSYTHLRAHET